MNKRICPRCHFTTDKKSTFVNHLNRKKICLPTYSHLSIKQIKKKMSITNQKKKSKCKKIIKEKNGKKKFICEYCDKLYSNFSNLKRHWDKCNEENKIKIEEIEYNMQQKINMLENKIEKLEKDKNVRDGSMNVMNIDNSININNSNIVIIKMNPFGYESLDHIDPRIIHKLICNKFEGLSELVKLTHFNPEHPENHNVYISNVQSSFAKALDKDGKWQLEDQKDLIESVSKQIYNKAMIKMNQCKLTENGKEKIMDAVTEIEGVDENNRTNELKTHLKEIKLALYNNRNMVKESISKYEIDKKIKKI